MELFRRTLIAAQFKNPILLRARERRQLHCRSHRKCTQQDRFHANIGWLIVDCIEVIASGCLVIGILFQFFAYFKLLFERFQPNQHINPLIRRCIIRNGLENAHVGYMLAMQGRQVGIFQVAIDLLFLRRSGEMIDPDLVRFPSTFIGTSICGGKRQYSKCEQNRSAKS